MRSEVKRFVVLAAILILAGAWIARAQLQSSGASVTVTSGTVTANQGGTWNVGIAAGSNNIGSVNIASGQTVGLAAGAASIGTVGLNAGTNLIGYTRPPNACSTTAYESGMTFLPTASTSVTATATCVTVIVLNNTSAAAVTVSVQDQSTACNSAACNVLSSFSIPANSMMDIPLFGAKMTGGIKWNAGTANALMGDILGNQ
jgi:hypothetical protein